MAQAAGLQLWTIRGASGEVRIGRMKVATFRAWATTQASHGEPWRFEVHDLVVDPVWGESDLPKTAAFVIGRERIIFKDCARISATGGGNGVITCHVPDGYEPQTEAV